MVKVQKPNPKSIKKDVSKKIKKPQIQDNMGTFKKKVKQFGKPLDIVAKNEGTKDFKSKGAHLNKNSRKVQLAKADETILKEEPIALQLKNVVKQSVLKETPNAAELHDDIKITLKKKSLKSKVEKKIAIVPKPKKKNEIENKNLKDDGQVEPNKRKKQKKDVKADAKKSSGPIYEQVDFDEDKFKNIVNLGNLKKICKALKVLVEKEVSEKKTSIFSDYRYFLNVSSYKIPSCPKRMVKLNLEHSLVDIKVDEVVMIVPDLQRGAKVDFDPTIQHYEDLLRGIGMDNIKIVPFNQLRNEFTTFEAKRKFANSYDYFLCDGRIVGHVVGFCGSYFQKPRTTIHAVRLNKPKTYKKDIEHALKRTSFRQLQKGDMISIPVGNHLFSTNQLAQNIEKVIEQLKALYPGGYSNIRKLHVRIDIKGTSSLPLYVSLAGAPAAAPNVVGPREQRMISLKKQANSILSKFNMSKAGEFVLLNKKEAKRKQKLLKVRKALLSNEEIKVDQNAELNPPLKKKAKTDKEIAPDSNMDENGSENGSVNSDPEDSDISDEE